MTGVEVAYFVIAAASIAAAAGGAVVSGIQQEKAAKFQAELAERDAALAEHTGEVNAAEARRRGRRLLAAQRAAVGASGLVLEEGTPLELFEQTAEDAEVDAMRIRFGSGVAQSQALARSSAATFEGESARTAGMIGAGTRVLSGTGSVLQSRI